MKLHFLAAGLALLPWGNAAQAAEPAEAATSSVNTVVETSTPAPSPMEKPTPAPADVKMPVVDFVEYDLPNGLHVILHRNTAAPVVSTYVYYHVGSKNERADRTGFAHFFEHLMFEGTQNIARGQIDKLVSAAGGNLNASTSFDRTDYYFNLPANQLGLALWIESERMMHAKVEAVGVETQRQVVKEERRRGVDNAPYGTLFENLTALVFAGTPYEWPPIGSAQYIDKASLEEFRDFYRHYYVPNNATLVVAGDFELEPTRRQIAEYFGPIPKGKTAIERPAFTLAPQSARKEKTIVAPTTPLPGTLHAWRAPALTDADAPAVEFLADILGTGRSSRLHERLVRQEEAAAEIEVFPYFLENGGVLGVFAVGNAGTPLERLDTLIDEEVRKIAEGGVTAAELQKVKNLKLRELASSYATMSARARSLAFFRNIFGDTNAINSQWPRYEAVTPEQVRDAAKKYLTPQGVNVLHFPAAK